MYGRHWWFAPHTVDEWMYNTSNGMALPTRFTYRLPPAELMTKYLLLSLSFGKIDAGRFESRYGVSFESLYGPAVDYAVQRGWMERPTTARPYHAIARGQFSRMPEIRSLFFSPECIEWFGELVDEAEEAAAAGRRRRRGPGRTGEKAATA